MCNASLLRPLDGHASDRFGFAHAYAERAIRLTEGWNRQTLVIGCPMLKTSDCPDTATLRPDHPQLPESYAADPQEVNMRSSPGDSRSHAGRAGF